MAFVIHFIGRIRRAKSSRVLYKKSGRVRACEWLYYTDMIYTSGYTCMYLLGELIVVIRISDSNRWKGRFVRIGHCAWKLRVQNTFREMDINCIVTFFNKEHNLGFVRINIQEDIFITNKSVKKERKNSSSCLLFPMNSISKLSNVENSPFHIESINASWKLYLQISIFYINKCNIYTCII